MADELPNCQLCGGHPVNEEHATETQRRWKALTYSPAGGASPAALDVERLADRWDEIARDTEDVAPHTATALRACADDLHRALAYQPSDVGLMRAERDALAADEQASRDEVERLREAVATEWYNGNLDENTMDRILGTTPTGDRPQRAAYRIEREAATPPLDVEREIVRDLADLSVADSPEFRDPGWEDSVRDLIRRGRLAQQDGTGE